MRRHEYRAILRELGLTQSWAGRVLANSEVTGRRWAITLGFIPESATILLRLMQAGVITRSEVEQAKAGQIHPAGSHNAPQPKRRAW